jgi:hypothetical protein
VNTWLPASTVARAVARQLLEGEPRFAPRWAPGSRILDDLHFMFRRGIERGAELRTRRGDRRESDPDARGSAPAR